MRSVSRYLPCLLFLALQLLPAGLRAEQSIELLTMEPGSTLWERFGHTAVVVRGEAQAVVFNFGALPPIGAGFAWSFVRGEADFYVVMQRYETMLGTYMALDRTVQSQRLLLPEAEAQELGYALGRAAMEPNNRYRYDQLYDNCATRVRDLIDHASHGALRRAAALRQPGRNYRDYTREAMAGHPVGAWALELLGGPHQDRPVNGYQEMYLPVHLRDRVAEARLGSHGEEGPLAAPIRTLYQRTGAPHLSTDIGAGRRRLLLAAALLWLLALFAARGHPPNWRRRTAGFAALVLALWSGGFGILVWPLALLSRVHNFSPNENAWLFLPFDLLCAVPLWRRFGRDQPLSPLLRGYVALRSLGWLVLLGLKLVGALPQHNAVFMAVSFAFVSVAASALRRPARPI